MFFRNNNRHIESDDGDNNNDQDNDDDELIKNTYGIYFYFQRCYFLLFIKNSFDFTT